MEWAVCRSSDEVRRLSSIAACSALMMGVPYMPAYFRARLLCVTAASTIDGRAGLPILVCVLERETVLLDGSEHDAAVGPQVLVRVLEGETVLRDGSEHGGADSIETGRRSFPERRAGTRAVRIEPV